MLYPNPDWIAWRDRFSSFSGRSHCNVALAVGSAAETRQQGRQKVQYKNHKCLSANQCPYAVYHHTDECNCCERRHMDVQYSDTCGGRTHAGWHRWERRETHWTACRTLVFRAALAMIAFSAWANKDGSCCSLTVTAEQKQNRHTLIAMTSRGRSAEGTHRVQLIQLVPHECYSEFCLSAPITPPWSNLHQVKMTVWLCRARFITETTVYVCSSFLSSARPKTAVSVLASRWLLVCLLCVIMCSYCIIVEATLWRTAFKHECNFRERARLTKSVQKAE